MTHPDLILGFDTSANYVSAALCRGADVVASAHEDMARGQGERLIGLLEEVLRDAGVQWPELTALGVGVGPGNFTGIRLSVSAARGLALGLDVPAVGVSRLEAVAFEGQGPRLACLKAPRDQAYVQGFETATEIAPHLIALADIPDIWQQAGLTCLGPVAEDVATRLGARTTETSLAPGIPVARIAATRWQGTTARPAPLYLKPADAAPSKDAPPVILDDR